MEMPWAPTAAQSRVLEALASHDVDLFTARAFDELTSSLAELMALIEEFDDV
jgi:hypothetical protein